MNKSATCKSAHRARSDRSRFAPCRRGRDTRTAHRQLFLEGLEGRVLLAAGDLDPTFGDGGLVTTDFGYLSPSNDEGRGVVAVQADRKILVAGRSYANGENGADFALARYNVDGTLDAGFGTGGKVVTNFSYYFDGQNGSQDEPRAVAVDATGKIVVAGSTMGPYGTGTRDWALARYNSDGSLDTSFDGDGKVITDFGGDWGAAQGVAIQADGKIVVAGYSQQGGGTGTDFAIARYNSDGSLDTDFDSDGKMTTDLGSWHDYAFGVAIQADGKIVVAGYSDPPGGGTGHDFAIARYNSDGSLDTDFDGDGKVTTNFHNDSWDYAMALAVGGDGKIVLAGYSIVRDNLYNHHFSLACYNSDGSLDTSFDGDGKVITDFGWGTDDAYGVAIDADGSVVVVGYSHQGASGYDFTLARYISDGSLDTSFDGDGKVTTDFGSSSDEAYGVAIDSVGNIVVVGSSGEGATDRDYALARYIGSDGSLDTTFGDDGKVTTDIGKPYTADEGTDLVAVQVDGRIVVVGSSRQLTTIDFALARYNSDGSLDTTFGTGGKVTTDFSNRSDYAEAVAIDADGNIVVAGYSSQGATSFDFAVARYNGSDGTLDTTFGDDGKVTTDLSSWGDYAYSVAIDSAGKILVAGNRDDHDFALVRYNTDGSLDTSFDGDGKVVTDFGSPYDIARDVTIDDAGKIVVAGGQHLARYNTDGSLDTSFDPVEHDGMVTLDVDYPYAFVAAGVTIDSNGKIVVGGSTLEDYGSGYANFALVRYNTDGSLDDGSSSDSDPSDSFGTDGLVDTDFGSSQEYAFDLAIDADGRIVVAGTTDKDYRTGIHLHFALARYNSDGSLDSTFGTGGLVTTDSGSDEDWAFGVVIDGDGKILVAGSSYQDGTRNDFALARYDADFGVGETNAPSAPVEGNTVITVSAIFADPDTTHTHTAVWDWGDGTTSPGAVTEPSSPGLVTGSHAYAAAGIYTITLTVNVTVDGTILDSDQSVFQYIVVFDPSGGFVTGGGTLDSPAGAWTADPALTGRATFGFVSRYQKGANTPDGHTVFHLNVGDLNFRSSSYQWLVVAGAHAKFKGTGTIGGSGDYGFMITATDGGSNSGVDEFRIEIWDAATSKVVYDNKLGEADDSYAGTAISSGNIIVHSGGKKLVADSAASQGFSGTWLTAAALRPVVSQAITYWGSAGYDGADLARLQSIEFRVADFADDRLGMASSSTNIIWIDEDAAGAGWHTGLGSDGAASTTGGFDLLTVVTHELGHVLGLEDLPTTHYTDHVMSGTLVPGSRRVGPDAMIAPWICLNSPPHGRSAFEAVDMALEDGFTRVDVLQPYEQLDTLVPSTAWDQQAVDRSLDEADWTSDGLTDKTTDDEQLDVDQDDLNQRLADILVTVL